MTEQEFNRVRQAEIVPPAHWQAWIYSCVPNSRHLGLAYTIHDASGQHGWALAWYLQGKVLLLTPAAARHWAAEIRTAFPLRQEETYKYRLLKSSVCFLARDLCAQARECEKLNSYHATPAADQLALSFARAA